MTKRFCPKCGAPLSTGVFCDNCNPDKTQERVVPTLQVSEYNRYFEKKTWHSFSDLEALITRRVQDVVDKKAIIHIEPFEFVPRSKSKTIVQVHVKTDNEEFTLPVTVAYRQCDIGQKQKSGYFEGVLQLRSPPQGVEKFIEKETQQLIKRGAFITKTVPAKNGVDLYLTDKHQMQLLAQRLIAHFGGSMELHPTLFSHNHQTSKDIYRLTVLVTFPPFSKGDVISYVPQKIRGQGEQTWLHITKMGKLMQGTNLLTGKLTAVELRLMSEIEVLPRLSTTIVQTHPELLVLHPETFQGEPVANAGVLKESFRVDQTVMVVSSAKGLLLVVE